MNYSLFIIVITIKKFFYKINLVFLMNNRIQCIKVFLNH